MKLLTNKVYRPKYINSTKVEKSKERTFFISPPSPSINCYDSLLPPEVFH